jgi:hypothetical protein
MRNLLFIAGLAAVSAQSAGAAAPTPLAPAVKQDLQCFVLYTIATGAETDETKKTGAIAGTWYFLGRLDKAAPGLDLEPAMRAEIEAMQSNPKTKQIGAACDALFSKRGADLVNLGANFRKSSN